MNITRIAFAALSLICLAGCHTVDLDSTGETQAVYQFGNFKMIVNANVTQTVNAAEAAFKQLDLYETGRNVNAYDARLESRARDDKKIDLRITEINSRQSMIVIHVGDSGNMDRSRELYEAIDAKLGKK